MTLSSHLQKRHQEIRKLLAELTSRAAKAHTQYERGDKTMCMTHLHAVEEQSAKLRDLISNHHYYSQLDADAEEDQLQSLTETISDPLMTIEPRS